MESSEDLYVFMPLSSALYVLSAVALLFSSLSTSELLPPVMSCEIVELIGKVHCLELVFIEDDPEFLGILRDAIRFEVKLCEEVSQIRL